MDWDARTTIVFLAMSSEMQTATLDSCMSLIEAGELEAAEEVLSGLRESIAQQVIDLRYIAAVDDLDEADVTTLVERFMGAVQEENPQMSEEELAKARVRIQAFFEERDA